MLIQRKSFHGGNCRQDEDLLDFSSNINPSGVPKAVMDAVVESARDCDVYPDPYCMELRKAISDYEGVPVHRILCGNGATELIYSYAFCLSGQRPVLLVSPTFSEYGDALQAAGIRTEHYFLSETNGFRLAEDFLKTDLSRFQAVFVCTPNNPTGISVDPALLRKIAETEVRLFADMCFLDLTDDPERYDIPNLVESYPNIVILRAYTKNFAIPGIRLGYVLCSDSDFLERMSEKAPCWNVSNIAQKAGVAASGCRQWLRVSVMEISEEKGRVLHELEKLGIRVFPGEANYLLLYSDLDLCGLLKDRRIAVRDCSDYAGLRKGFARVAIRTRAENDLLLDAVREVCNG